jgi:hypothetical protein
MKYALIAISMAALVVLFVGPTLYAMGHVGKPMGEHCILGGTIGWFATAPFWIGRH